MAKDTPQPQNAEYIKQHFEENMLDGDAVQKGQMLAAPAVLEYIQELLAWRDSYYIRIAEVATKGGKLMCLDHIKDQGTDVVLPHDSIHEPQSSDPSPSKGLAVVTAESHSSGQAPGTGQAGTDSVVRVGVFNPQVNIVCSCGLPPGTPHDCRAVPSSREEELEVIEDAMMRVAMGVQKDSFLPHDVHQEAVDLTSWHTQQVEAAVQINEDKNTRLFEALDWSPKRIEGAAREAKLELLNYLHRNPGTGLPKREFDTDTDELVDELIQKENQ